jgi:hypothetical protein
MKTQFDELIVELNTAKLMSRILASYDRQTSDRKLNFISSSLQHKCTVLHTDNEPDTYKWKLNQIQDKFNHFRLLW